MISGVKFYTNMAFGTAKSVLFIEVSSFQGVLIRVVPLYFLQVLQFLRQQQGRWACVMLSSHSWKCMADTQEDNTALKNSSTGLEKASCDHN